MALTTATTTTITNRVAVYKAEKVVVISNCGSETERKKEGKAAGRAGGRGNNRDE